VKRLSAESGYFAILNDTLSQRRQINHSLVSLSWLNNMYHISAIIWYSQQKWKKSGGYQLPSLADFSPSVTRQTPEQFW
jgi:hypothetical protein